MLNDSFNVFTRIVKIQQNNEKNKEFNNFPKAI